MLINRLLAKKICALLSRKEFISIIGPRQAGKTTLLELLKNERLKKNKTENIKIITFEDKKLLFEFDADPVSFVNSYRKNDREKLFLMLDEFQYAPNGGRELKLVYDTCQNIKVIVTGSSSLDLKAKVGKFMVGRMFDFYLSPFSFHEFLIAKNTRASNLYTKKNFDVVDFLNNKTSTSFNNERDPFYNSFLGLFEEFCLWGGYPAVVLENNVDNKRKILSEILNKYLLKDISGLLQLASEKNLLLLAQFLAVQNGQILVYNNLAKEAGLDYINTKKHLNILEQTFIIKLLRPYFNNRNKELSKNPKVYFMDLGFRNMLLENMNDFSKRVDAGQIVENAVFVKLNQIVADGYGKINFWRTKVGAEVDFILSIDGNIIPIEVKYTLMDKPEVSRGLISFMKDYKSEIAIVLTKNYWGKTNVLDSKKIIFVPVYYFI